MLNVLITVDTEVWPRTPGLQGRALDPEIDRDIYGRTPRGEFGIRFQTEHMNAHGLKAVYFVESLFAGAAGIEPLAGIVECIQDAGHDVQLHLHPEWLGRADLGILAGRPVHQNIMEYSQEEQEVLLRKALQNLQAAGAHDVTAFRAGNFGASADTLRALSRCGIAYDTSYNVTIPGSTAAMELAAPIQQPRHLHGVIEIPVNSFEDRPGHLRSAQINGCSSSEMENALLKAWGRGWQTFVIVTHGFELMNHRRTGPDPIVMRRFVRLCRFLSRHADKFRTVTFADLPALDTSMDPGADPIRSSWARTSWRLCEQTIRKAFR